MTKRGWASGVFDSVAISSLFTDLGSPSTNKPKTKHIVCSQFPIFNNFDFDNFKNTCVFKIFLNCNHLYNANVKFNNDTLYDMYV